MRPREKQALDGWLEYSRRWWPIRSPAGATKVVNGGPERPRGAPRRPFHDQAGLEKAVRELLTVSSPQGRVIEPIVYDGRPATLPVRVEKREVAEYTGDAGEVGDESYGGSE